MKNNQTKVIIPCRFSYLHCWEPVAINNSEPKYSVSAIIPKSDTKTVEAIKAAVEQAKKEGVAISLGLTRRESWGGIQLLRLIPAVGVSILVAVLAAVSCNALAAPWQLLVLCLGIQLFCAALGTLLGLVYLKWGKFGTLLTVLMAIFAGGLGGFGAVMGFETLGVDRLFSGDVLPWLILAFGAICYGLVQLPEGRTLAHMQVKI